MRSVAFVVVAFVLGILVGLRLQDGAQAEVPEQATGKTPRATPTTKIPEPPAGRRRERMIEIATAEKLDGLDKAVILHDLEVREAYRREIEDRDAGIEAEFSIPTPYALSMLEAHLRSHPKDVEARALLVKYLCFASIAGQDEVDINLVRRAETEARLVGRDDTLDARASLRRLRVELAGYFAAFATRDSEKLEAYLESVDVAKPE